jgi:hypothetical protein
MRPIRKTSRSPEDFENLGKAFEGLAGYLHEGHPLEAADVAEACRLAHELWPVRGGGRDWNATTFEEARHACLANLEAAAGGDMHACIELERACHAVGMALRERSRAAEPTGTAAKPWGAAQESRTAIRHLDQRYARYAMRPVALAL